MKTPDFDRIRYVTRHLGDLQSGVISILPLGLLFLFSGLRSYSGNALWFLPMVASLGVPVFMMFRAQRYLEARFGRAEKKKWVVSDGVKLSWIVVGIVLACVSVSFLVYSASIGSTLPDRLFYLLFGGLFVFRFIYREYRLVEVYNLGIAALFLAIATRGAFPALTPPAWLWNHSGMQDILQGSALVLSSLLDYWQLARTLPPIAEESEALETEETR